MSRRVFYLLMLVISIPLTVVGQFGNEWISFDKEYVKVSVGQNGVHEISGEELMQIGVDLSSIDPGMLQLFHRGLETAIEVNDGGDASFDANDKIRFYGVKNDGTLDAQLYEPSSSQLHAFYNLYSDTTSFFLTWNITNGKRINSYSEANTSSIPKDPFRIALKRNVNADRYARGDNLNYNSFSSTFDVGEGYTSTRVQENNALNFTISGLLQAVPSEGIPLLNLQLLGERVEDHYAEIYAGPDGSSLRLLGSASFTEYETYFFSSPLNWTDISPSGDLFVRISVLGVSGGNDLMSCTYLEVEYPADFDANLGDLTINLKAEGSGKSFIEIANPAPTAVLWDLTDYLTPIEIGYVLNGSNAEAIVNDTEVERKLMLSSTIITPKLEKVNMRSLDPSDNGFIIISHSSLMTAGGSYADPVKEYGAYRSSAQGGGYDTLIVDIDQLYNQFSYGEVTPLAIYRFVDYMSQTATPGNLFIIGKSVNVRFNYGRNPSAFTYKDLVPTSGFPGSDIAFSIGLNSVDRVPIFPVGRIPASTADDVANYLDKVIEMESTPFDELWRKDGLHLSGGISAGEQTQFFSYMERFRGFAEDVYMGGKVRTVKKNAIENVTFINVSEQINNGQNFVTFYGHSNPNITDIDIGRVTDPLNGYANKGKYPVFLINGCEAGRIFENAKIWGEDWILAKDKGAVEYIAHSSYGLASRLQIFSNLFYQSRFSFQDYVNNTIGQIHLKTLQDYANTYNMSNYWDRGMVYQMVLMGDPGYVPFNAKEPDYEINQTGIAVSTFSAEPLSAQLDSFAFDLVVRNFGLANRDSLRIQTTRYFVDGSSVVYDSLLPPILYADTVHLVIKNEGNQDNSGLNRFLFTLDPGFEFDELDELNNEVSFDLFIPLNGTKNLYPQGFSIVSENQVDFRFQSTSPLTTSETYQFELDTTYSFDSPFKISRTIDADVLAIVTETLLEDIPENDSTVYYWRTKILNPDTNQNDKWSTSSFSYFKNSPTGWSQSNFYQHLGNKSLGIYPDSTSGTWNFEESTIQVDITTYGNYHPANNKDVSVRFNEVEYIINNGRPCREQSLNLIAFDKESALPYAVLDLPFQDVRTCGRQPQVINSFSVNEFENGSNDLSAYIDEVAVGDTVILFSIGNIAYTLWSASIKSKLELLGIDASVFDAVNNHEAIIIIGSKGSPVGSATVLMATESPANEAELTLAKSLIGRSSSGGQSSPFIGPATQWGVFSKEILSLGNTAPDIYSFSIFSRNTNQSETLEFSGTLPGNTNVSGIDASSNPYLRLDVELKDTVDLTPPQPERWTVLYEYPPEGVLWGELTDTKISLSEGEEFTSLFYFMNISPIAFNDSLKVEYSVRNKTTNQTDLSTFNIAAPSPGDTTTFPITITTINRVGLNDISVVVNPSIEPEQFYDNNVINLPDILNVSADQIAPAITVKVDGRTIFDGEIVSAQPEIMVELADENQFRILSDTTLMDVYIRKPCEGCTFERISYSNAKVSFEAPDVNDKLQFSYRPEDLSDGIYTLKVSASDVSGNRNPQPLELSFEVVSTSSITNFYPYPNPFSDRMRFVFTLTGEEIPDELSIRIMTVTGRVIKEINKDELGDIHIGNNRTSYYWDGTDEYGDRLGNGVYLYQVKAKSNGKEIKFRASEGDGAFKNGIGKIYLAR